MILRIFIRRNILLALKVATLPKNQNMKIDATKKEENKIILQRDKNLIKRVLEGDSESFGILMTFYCKRVQALGFQFFRNSEDSEDFVQEVFLKVYKNLSSFRGESSFATWITRIAFTTALNSKKRVRNVGEFPEGLEVPSRMNSPEDQQIRNLTADAVNEAVKDLPEKYSICLELYFFHDLSYEEISVITMFPVNTIKSHIFRAKKILRDKLKDFYS